MSLQYQDIISPVSADYVKEEAIHPGTLHLSLTLTIKVYLQRVFHDHTKSEKKWETLQRGVKG